MWGGIDRSTDDPEACLAQQPAEVLTTQNVVLGDQRCQRHALEAWLLAPSLPNLSASKASHRASLARSSHATNAS